MAEGSADRPWSFSSNFINLCVSVSSCGICRYHLDTCYCIVLRRYRENNNWDIPSSKIKVGHYRPWCTCANFRRSSDCLSWSYSVCCNHIHWRCSALRRNCKAGGRIFRSPFGLAKSRSYWRWYIIDNHINSSNGITNVWGRLCRHTYSHSPYDHGLPDDRSRRYWRKIPKPDQ